MEEFGIHTIHIVGGTQKCMHNIQTRSQSESNLTTIYILYIVKKWDQNDKGNDNRPQDAEKSPP